MGRTRGAPPDPWAERRGEREARRRRRLRERERRRRERAASAASGWQGEGSCGRKARYATRQEAESFADGLRARFGAGCPAQEPYRCELCGGWHLTSHPWRRGRAGADCGGDGDDVE